MRSPRKWEEFEKDQTNREWSREMQIPERIKTLDEDLFEYLEPDELDYVLSKGNKATALLFLQSRHLLRLKQQTFTVLVAFVRRRVAELSQHQQRGKEAGIVRLDHHTTSFERLG